MTLRKLFLFATLFGLPLVMTATSAETPAAAASCVACHGANGVSPAPIWPSLAGQGSNYIVAQIKAFKAGVRSDPSMSQMVAQLSDSDMKVVGDHFASLPAEIAPMGDEDFSAAEKLFRGGDAGRNLPACMACHGPSGAGNAPAAFPALRGQHPTYTISQLKAYRDGSRTTDAQEVMRDIAAKMTDAEIESLARYVSSLH